MTTHSSPQPKIPAGSVPPPHPPAPPVPQDLDDLIFRWETDLPLVSDR